jgi:hypothetical protein
MTTWYRTGTISMNTSATTESYLGISYTGRQIVTAGSTAPLWSSSLLSIGEGIQLPDGRVYEIAALNQATQKVYITSEYSSTSFTNQAYQILPMQGYIKSLANRAAELVSSYGTAIDSALAGKFSDGTESAPGISYVADTDTGIRRVASGTQAIVANGVAVVTVGPAGLEATTIDTTNLEVTNIKAKDGTSSITVSDSSGNVSISKNVTLGDATTDTVTVKGYMSIGGNPLVSSGLYISPNALSSSSQYGLVSSIVTTTGATSQAVGVYSDVTTPASVFTVGSIYAYYAGNAIKGAGSVITSAHGLYIADQTQGTNNYGITSAVSSGTNKWNIYASGTATNYFAGSVSIGTSTLNAWASTYKYITAYFSGGLFSSASGDVGMVSGAYNNGTNWIYTYTQSPTKYEFGPSIGRHAFYTASTGTVGNTVTFTERLGINQTEVVFNDTSSDYDFRVESDTNTHALFIDASTSKVGINNSTPSEALSVIGSVTASVSITEAGKAVVSQADVGTEPNQVPLNQYLGQMAYRDNVELPILPGAGITLGTGTICKGAYTSESMLKQVRIVVDLTGLKGGGTAGDLIGSDSTTINSTKQPCFIGQVPPGMTVLGGRMTCLETPAGGGTDIDLYSALEGTGVHDSAVGGLTETQLINAGVQAIGAVTYLVADPATASYLYLVSQGTSTTAYTAGRFLVELFGV